MTECSQTLDKLFEMIQIIKKYLQKNQPLPANFASQSRVHGTNLGVFGGKPVGWSIHSIYMLLCGQSTPFKVQGIDSLPHFDRLKSFEVNLMHYM